jgi:hypothetical protein
MLEVMTPEQTARYIEISHPAFIEKVFAGGPEAHIPETQPTENLNLIG